MDNSSNEFVTVHMRGLKTALAARALAEFISVSMLVRRAVERELTSGGPPGISMATHEPPTSPSPIVKMSLRLPAADAGRFKARARRAGLSGGAFVMGLLAEPAALAHGIASRPDRLAALTVSCAELSTLNRNISRLTALLRHGDVQPARDYQESLDVLAGEVRAHLRLAASVLADLRPARGAARSAESLVPEPV